MLEGNRVTRKITIPEGYTVKMIVEMLQNNTLLLEEIKTLPAEGSLMPDTYFYYFGDSKQSVISKMQNQMTKTLSKLSKANKTNIAMNDIIILASIIEKEAATANEFPIISSVFHNRLAKKMRLQSDPTIIYAMSNGYGKIDRNLTRKDLWLESKYNTYRNPGFPPTAICCPGEKAIIAAMNPAKTNYLYFVLQKDGKRHLFTADYKVHLKNIKNK
jgi:UPF0755 protein